jgi:hypothetical protein
LGSGAESASARQAESGPSGTEAPTRRWTVSMCARTRNTLAALATCSSTTNSSGSHRALISAQWPRGLLLLLLLAQLRTASSDADSHAAPGRSCVAPGLLRTDIGAVQCGQAGGQAERASE